MRERDIFAAARERTDPALRAEFLDAVCAGDTALRARVERLLQADATPDSIFDMPATHTPAVGDGVTRTVAPLGEEEEGPTRTISPAQVGDPAYGETKSPDEAASDFDLKAILSPPQESGSLGRLDHYEVLEVVGSGGMGVVLKAHDTKLRRVVALKLLAPALAAVGTARKRFAREAQSAAAVRDEHVVDIHEVCEGAAVPYLVMEFISGITLEDRIRAEGPLPVREVVRVGLQSARGLAAAHAQGLVHRDVKPGNILLEGGAGRVKLTDFGLARAADDASISRSGVIAGTPMYMSPEQAKGDHIDHRSDLFSLGSVLYTLCTGRPAFRAESTVAVLRRVCKDDPRPIQEVNPDVPRWVRAVVEKLLAKDPADRFQTAAEVADLLARYLAHLEDPDRVPPPPAVRGVRVRGTRQARRAAIAAVALVAVGALSVAGYLAFRPKDEAPVAQTTPEPAPGEKPAVSNQPPTAEELAARPSPLDGRTREQIPASMLALLGGPARVSSEVVAVLGDDRFRLTRLPPEGTHAEMRQDREGKFLAVPNGNSVALFDARTGERIRTLTARADQVHAVAFSPDGLSLAGLTETDPKTPYAIKIWELQTGKEVISLRGTAVRPWTISYGPDSKQLFCLSPKGLDVWDVAGEKITRSFPATPAPATKTPAAKAPAAPAPAAHPLYSFGLSHDGKKLAWGDDSPQVKVWTVGSDDPPRLLAGHTVRIKYAAFSSDGKVLATGSDKELILWDAEKLELVKKIDTAAAWLAFEPDGKTILTATCTTTPNPGGHVVKRWDLSTFQGQPLPLLHPKPGHVQLSRDGKTLFFLVGDARDRERRVRPYEAAAVRPLSPQSGTDEVWSVAASPDGSTIASGETDGTIRLWNLAEWAAGAAQPPSRVLIGHTAAVYSVAFSPNSKFVASGSEDGTIRLWNAATGETVRTLARDTKTPFSDVAFSTDGKTLATGEADGSVQLWEVPSAKPEGFVATGEKQSPLRWHNGHVNSVAFSPDGRFLASAGAADRKVHLTDLKTFRRVQTFGPAGDGKADMRVAFSGDGRTLAFGGWDDTVRLWDTVEKKETALTGGPTGLDGLAIDPTGRFVAASRAGVVRFWDRNAPNRPLTVGPGPFGTNARHIAFTPEGRYLLVAGANGTVSVLRTPPPRTTSSPAAEPLASADAVKRLRAAIEVAPTALAALAAADFAQVPLTKSDAAAARTLLWEAHVAAVRKERAEEVKNRAIRDGKLEMPFTYQTFGEKPKDGWSLYISLHGGGGVSKAANDQQWESQKNRYTIDEGIYLTPRAPTDTPTQWYESHIDRMLTRLIEDLVVFEGVNPNRVYLLGCGAGGDGVYQLGPRLADRWAAAAMTGGHPNTASPLSLRNVPFAIQVGANDSAYDRNAATKEFGKTLDVLRRDDPKGYEHFVKIHAGKGHWADLDDKAALPWMAKFTRNPVPERVVWKLSGAIPSDGAPPVVLRPHHECSYWLAVPPGQANLDALVVANREGQTVEIVAAEGAGKLLIRFDDRMVDLDKPVTVKHAGKVLFAGTLPRTVGVMIRTLSGRGDPGLVFDAEVEVDLSPAPDSPDAKAQVNLGVALLNKGQLDEAIAHFRRAIELDPKYAPGHFNLGVALGRKGQRDEAIASYRKAIELDPKNVVAHNNLGEQLARKGQSDEAIASYRKAIDLNPKFALAHSNLGLELSRKGQLDEAIAAFRTSLEINPKQTNVQNELAHIQRLKFAQEKLPAFLKGEFKPTTNDERLGLSDLCLTKKLYRAAANLSAEIFAADSKLADDLTTARRYNAACAAVLAAAGQGEDAAKLDDKERVRLRKLALDWLRADFVLITKSLESGQPAVRAEGLRRLKHWPQDNDLAGIRDAAALEKLPAEERAEFTKLWADVAALLKKAEPVKLLTEAEQQVEEVRKELKKRNPDFDGSSSPGSRTAWSDANILRSIKTLETINDKPAAEFWKSVEKK